MSSFPPIAKLLKDFTQGLLGEVYPPLCPVCEMEIAAPAICLSCRRSLPQLTESVCPQCGHFRKEAEPSCRMCAESSYPPKAFYCAFLYESSMISLVHDFKYHDRPYLAPLLVDLLWEKLSDTLIWEAPDCIIPIPLHPFKLIKRRYNQSALLAVELAKYLQRPLVTNGLFRIKMTPSQSLLDRPARLVNLKGAFRAQSVAGQAVLLVDDIVTSGATMMEASDALMRAGAARVALVCLARTAPEHHLLGSQ